jgi:hypothetical protein
VFSRIDSAPGDDEEEFKNTHVSSVLCRRRRRRRRHDENEYKMMQNPKSIRIVVVILFYTHPRTAPTYALAAMTSGNRIHTSVAHSTLGIA